MSERLTRGELDERVDLAKGAVVDITTTGRRSGRPRRIEIVFHNIGGRIYISGTPPPRRRNWLANLDARPELTLHLRTWSVSTSPRTLASSRTSPKGAESLHQSRGAGVETTQGYGQMNLGLMSKRWSA
jgi:deazaflavin-dependent oxidoreductase (nitroreductase family)